MTFISLNAILGLPLQPWSWKAPSISSRKTLIKLNNAQERPNIAHALQKNDKIIITGPPSSGKHHLFGQLMSLCKAGKIKAEIIVDEGIDWTMLELNGVCILDIQMNTTLTKCLNAMKIECNDTDCLYKTDREYLEWTKRHENLMGLKDKVEIIEFVNKLDLNDKKEFWYHYNI